MAPLRRPLPGGEMPGMATVWLWLHADTLGVTMDRVKLLRGRMFRPTAAARP